MHKTILDNDCYKVIKTLNPEDNNNPQLEIYAKTLGPNQEDGLHLVNKFEYLSDMYDFISNILGHKSSGCTLITIEGLFEYIEKLYTKYSSKGLAIPCVIVSSESFERIRNCESPQIVQVTSSSIEIKLLNSASSIVIRRTYRLDNILGTVVIAAESEIVLPGEKGNCLSELEARMRAYIGTTNWFEFADEK